MTETRAAGVGSSRQSKQSGLRHQDSCLCTSLPCAPSQGIPYSWGPEVSQIEAHSPRQDLMMRTFARPYLSSDPKDSTPSGWHSGHSPGLRPAHLWELPLRVRNLSPQGPCYSWPWPAWATPTSLWPYRSRWASGDEGPAPDAIILA